MAIYGSDYTNAPEEWKEKHRALDRERRERQETGQPRPPGAKAPEIHPVRAALDELEDVKKRINGVLEVVIRQEFYLDRPHRWFVDLPFREGGYPGGDFSDGDERYYFDDLLVAQDAMWLAVKELASS